MRAINGAVKSTAHPAAKARSRRTQGAAKTARRPGPLSVSLAPELRQRIEDQARKRNLKLATAARVFLAEHVDELEGAMALAKAEEWQRAQAWATWEKIRAGDAREVSWDKLKKHTHRALERVGAADRAS